MNDAIDSRNVSKLFLKKDSEVSFFFILEQNKKALII